MTAALMAALATTAAALASLALLPPRPAGAAVAALALGLFLLSRVVPAVGKAVAAVPTSGFVAAHVARFAAVSFLILNDGAFEAEFSTRFAVGEIAAAITAAGVLWLLSMPLERSPRSLVLWSLFGIVNAGWGLFLWSAADALLPRSGLTVGYFGFLVPLALATHLELLRRSLSTRKGRHQ